MNIKTFNIFLLLIFISASIQASQIDSRITKYGNLGLTGENYITGDDGIVRMPINVWGHVKSPGTYLIYDSVDILTLLSIAGGPLKGANFKNVTIISNDGHKKNINIDKMISNRDLFTQKIEPYDTIVVEEKFGSFILSKSNLINTILQILNLILYIENND